MSLASLLGEDTKTNGIEVSPERIKNNLDKYQHIIAYWRMYPDRLVDHYCAMNPNNKFHFYWFQRLMLRAIMRHKYTYMVFCRAYSKSFVGVLGMMLKAILYPGIKIFTVSEGKEQSAAILSSKLTEICTLIPALQKEIIWDNRGSLENSRQTKDTVVYVFKNGSHIENVQANDKARGRRYHSGNLEEAICLPQDMLEQVIIPMLNVPRSVNGQVDPNEVVNQSQCFITSAGFKNTYSYNRLVEMLCQSVAEPRKAFVIGGDYRVPVRFGLFSKDFLKDLKVQGTFNAATFEREYCSKWTGSVEGSFFDPELIDRNRINKLPEYSPNGRNNDRAYYLLGVDVGRLRCTTEICVFKITPAPTGVPLKQLVNLISIGAENFTYQAIEIKKIFNKYNCRAAVVDGNGLGAGLTDLLILDQIDPDTGDTLYGWGVINDDNGVYRKYKTPNTIYKALYIMKSNTNLNSEMYSYAQTQLQHGKIKFLVDENIAKNDRAYKSSWKKKRASDRVAELQPYVMTTALREQMINLVEEDNHGGANIILKPANRKISHDRFSAMIYGLYYCKLEEEKAGAKQRDIGKFLFFSKC